MAILKNTTINDTGNLRIPVGTTAQRPSPTAGQFRYNTTTNGVEIYTGGANIWQSAAARGVRAAGGTVYDVDVEGTIYRVHVFTSTGNSTFTVTRPGTVEYLIVAGGGQGGGNCNSCGGAGAGGAGGLLTGFTTLTPQSYTFTVGAGGSGGIGNTNSTSAHGGNGGNSVAFALTAIGGGGGRPQNGQAGGSGGSGGGGSGGSSPVAGAGGAGTSGQGNAGGAGSLAGNNNGGGGGGAGGIGQAGVSNSNGGAGLVSIISGISTFYAGGGGGGAFSSNTPGTAGFGGGGNGANISINSGNGFAATPNTGGGGGGAVGSNIGGIGGLGGSGIVVIRYPLQVEPDVAAPKAAGNGLVLDLDFAKPTVYSGTGTAVNDSRLNGISGTLNGPTIQNIRTHRAEAVYTGNQSITVSGSGIQVSNTSFSIQWWVRKTLVGQPHIQIGGGNYANAPDVTAGVSIGTSSDVQSFRAQITDGSVNRRISISPFGFQDGVYTMITYVVNRSNGTSQLYKDAVLVGSLNLGTFGNSSTSNSMSIGGANSSAKAYVKFYNIPFTAEEVANNFNATRWRFGV